MPRPSWSIDSITPCGIGDSGAKKAAILPQGVFTGRRPARRIAAPPDDAKDMPSTLLTSRGDIDAAIDRLLARAQASLDVFDHDLSALGLDRPPRQVELRRLLDERAHRLRIVVQDGSRLPTGNPRLLALHEAHAHHFQLLQAADTLTELRDGLLIADGRHALVRFHRDQARARLIEDDENETRPYALRFADILAEGCTPLGGRVAGL